MERYEGYRTRAVPIKIAVGTDPRTAAFLRLTALRELMRLEMPERISDLCDAAELNDLQADLALNAINPNPTAKTAALTTLPAVSQDL